MAEHTIVFEIWYDAGWHTVPTYNRDEVVITRGRQDQLQQVSPSKLTLTINNREGVYSPRNANSALYGKIGRNTRCRVTIDGNVRFVGEVEAWPQRWSSGDFDVWVPITANGVTYRLGMPGQKVRAKSPLAGSIPAAGAVAYWRMEDGASAGLFGSGVSGGTPMSVTNADLASTDDLIGSRPLAAFTATTALAGEIAHQFAGEWSVIWLAKFPAALGGLATLLDVQTPGGTAVRWVVAADATTVLLTGYDATGTAIFSTTNTTNVYAAMFSGEWVAIALEADPTGSGTVTCNVYDLDGFRNGVGVTTGLLFGSPGHFAVPASSFLTGMGMGHLAALTATGPEYAWPGGGPGGPTAAAAYAGEMAHERIDRLGTEEDIAVTIVGFVSPTSPLMGVQAVDTPLNLMRDAAGTDLGIFHEPRDDFGLVHRCYETVINQDPGLTLTYGQAELGGPLEPTEDLDYVQNDVTATRRDGASGRVVQETGPLNVQESVDDPEGVGRFPVEYDLSLYSDEQAVHHAGFRMRVGTSPEARYPVVTADLDALDAQGKTSLVADAVALDLGDVIQVDNPPEWAQVNPIKLVVQGCTEKVSIARRVIEFNTVPAQPYEVRVWANESPPDQGDHMGRWATEFRCAIRAAIDDNDTSVLIDPPIGRWTTTAADLSESNYDALYAEVGGERVKVTAIATTACTAVAAGTADHDDNAAVTPADYAGGAANQWAFVVARARDGASLAITDSNYTYQLLRQQRGLYLWATVRAAAAPAPTVTPSGGAAGGTVSAVQFGFANMPITLDDLTDAIIIATSKNNVSDQDIDYSRLRAGSLPGRLVLIVAGKSDDWTGGAAPSGFTELVDVSSTTGNDQGLWVGYRIDTTPTGVTPGKLAITGGATAVSESMIVALGSGFQTLTVERSANGVVKSHAAGAPIETVDPLIWAL